MMKSKRASVAIYTLMIGVVIIITALAMSPILQDFTTSAMNESTENSLGMDCDNNSISSFTKSACLATDLSLFYFIGVIIFLGGIIISSKVVFG